MPTTLPSKSTSGRHCARIDGGVGLQIISYMLMLSPLRPLALMMPCVTEPARPNGAPTASTRSPISMASESRIRGPASFILDVEQYHGHVGAAIDADVLRRELAAIEQMHDRVSAPRRRDSW